MSLPTCPSCGQSVLEDNVLDCPFCGAAMDGSRGSTHMPKAKGNPGLVRPGQRKPQEKPAEPARSSAPTPAASAPPEKPAARPAMGGRGAKTVVDEDDPFGIGASTAAQAIQASLRPDKTRLLKVVCPMCEQTGFVPKNAMGKSVKCANEKCMVPIFTATDPSEKPAEKKTVRVSDQSQSDASLSAMTPQKRNPIMLYAIAGAAVLGLTGLVVTIFNNKAKEPTTVPGNVDITKFEDMAKEEERQKLAAAAAAAVKAPPKAEEIVLGHAKKMISLSRGNGLRDKALARRLTGDLLLRIDQTADASSELKQLEAVDPDRIFYRMMPHLSAYWRAVGKNDQKAAKASLASAEAEVRNITSSGRMATECLLALSAALVKEGRMPEAQQYVAARQMDRSIPSNRDLVASTAWAFVAAESRDAGIPAPAVLDATLWTDPLHLAVAVDLAIHQQWDSAIAWCQTASDARSYSDAIVAVADVARAFKSPAAAVKALGTAQSQDPVFGIRITAGVAAVQNDVARLDATVAELGKLPALTAVPLPTSLELVQNDVPVRVDGLSRAVAASEVIRSAVLLGKPEIAQAAMVQLQSALASAAPPTADLRRIAVAMDTQEAATRKQVGTELRVSDEAQLAGMFRNYRRHAEQLVTAAEDRRLLMTLLLSRVVRAGGYAALVQSLDASPEWKEEVLMDDMSKFIAVSALAAGVDQAQVDSQLASLQEGMPRHGVAKLLAEICAVVGNAWGNRDADLGTALQYLNVGSETLPGIRQAMACELTQVQATRVKDPAQLLSSILAIQNGLWKEECFAIATQEFAARNMDQAVLTWIDSNKVPVLEQITALYGLSLGILARPEPADATTAAPAEPKKG
ncbi:MAG: hypothetical protein JNM43_04075 [Planctomycetaceae bacterium]|nr:hypothetical protein [Planctomycetaceae bacterium]